MNPLDLIADFGNTELRQRALNRGADPAVVDAALAARDDTEGAAVLVELCELA